jgi:hypothetical protein
MERMELHEAKMAVASVLDVVEELVIGLANGEMPEKAWAETVQETFSEHRIAMGLAGPGVVTDTYTPDGRWVR